MAMKRELTNSLDKHAVAVVKLNSTVMGHIPYNMASVISSLLGRNCNKRNINRIEKRVKCGAGYGLEEPCIYHLYGTKKNLKHLEGMVSRLRD